MAEPDSVLASTAADEGPRWLPPLLALVSLLPNPGAALPFLTYYFRDFSLSYYPILDFVGDEVRSGRWPFWNPYLYEGSPFLPAFYPIELLHILWPGPAMVSWLLTLHFPLAALAMYALTRDLGACRYGAFAAGAVYSMCGLCLSALNVQMFLQSMAWAPLLALSLRRSARGRPRATAAAAVCLAVSISTLGVEFVAQAVLLGIGVGLAARCDRGAVARLGAAIGVGAAIAGIPIAVMLGIVSGSVRSEGMLLDMVQKSVHPALLLQLVIPDLPGSIAEPERFWWGGRLYAFDSPYFLSLYLGPVALCAAAVGAGALPGRTRGWLLGLSLAALWYSLGAWGGLAPALAPLVRVFRFPVKAMLTPCFVVALAAGLGVTRLRAGRGWRLLLAPAAVAALASGTLAQLSFQFAPELSEWFGVSGRSGAAMRAFLLPEAVTALGFAVLVAGFGLAARAGRLQPRRAAVALLALLVVDLWRGGGGLNRQVAPRFFDPVPELTRHLDGLDGGRFFSFGIDRAPAAEAFREARAPGTELLGFFMGRQVLNPFLNVLDRVEVAEGPDRHSLIPNPVLLAPWDSLPSRFERILPVLRNASVTRLASLDPLQHPSATLRERFPAGPPNVWVHIYDLAGSAPRSHVACRVVVARSRQQAQAAAFDASFDPARDVALEVAGGASCSDGQVARRALSTDESEFDVELDGAGYLVVRDSWAKGWRATVDGASAPVLRANGRHQAIAVEAGRHRVAMDYSPPGLGSGALLSVAGLAGLVALARGRPAAREGPGVRSAA